ncbi:hypothetical protein DPMN_072367 [Dreissena polymorpha]|uniref:Uncharacterized protein n=1 Tax=Dreissena polymorpha TaxID=45954 RepID=A0A9D3Z8K6_DREPO|nr:hypothetical protein DPMN_072367 [Dreissena polymorpha]
MYRCFDPVVASGVEEGYDIGEDLGISRTLVCTGSLPCNEMGDEQYLQHARLLNVEQKNILYYILQKVKTRSLPFYIFFSGSAGCGSL